MVSTHNPPPTPVCTPQPSDAPGVSGDVPTGSRFVSRGGGTLGGLTPRENCVLQCPYVAGGFPLTDVHRNPAVPLMEDGNRADKEAFDDT